MRSRLARNFLKTLAAGFVAGGLVTAFCDPAGFRANLSLEDKLGDAVPAFFSGGFVWTFVVFGFWLIFGFYWSKLLLIWRCVGATEKTETVDLHGKKSR